MSQTEAKVQTSMNAPEHKQLESGAEEHRTESLVSTTLDSKEKAAAADMARMSAASEEPKSPVRNKQKRMVHNEVERRRKVKINNHIFNLTKLLPNMEGKKWSKNEVLTKAIDYIQEIKQNHEKILIGKMDEVQANEFKTLKKRIEDLEKQNSQYVKLLEIAGYSPALSGGMRPQCDKLFNKVDPTTIIMDDDGEISVVSPSSQIDNSSSSGKRRAKVESQLSPKKKFIGSKSVAEANGAPKTSSNERVLLSPISSLNRAITPQQMHQSSSENLLIKKLESVTTAPINVSHQIIITKPFVTTQLASSSTLSHPNFNTSKEPVAGSINGGVTAVTHSLQGGPIMSTSQSSPQLQMQQTATVVSQIPMLNFGGTVNLMQRAQMQPVLTINDQGIQVIQMMATQNGQVVMNPNNSSTPNLLLAGNATPTGTALVQQGNGVQIDCPAGPSQTLISTDTAGIPVLQQTVCGGPLIAQGTQYVSNLTTNPQVHLMTNSPPVIPATPNRNVVLGASVQGAPHANTVLTLNPNSSSNQLPSALVLPNGQIIPVVREPQLPLIYQNQAPISGSLLMSATSARNSPCTVFGANSGNAVSTVTSTSTTIVTNVSCSNDIIVCSEAGKPSMSLLPQSSVREAVSTTKLNISSTPVNAAVTTNSDTGTSLIQSKQKNSSCSDNTVIKSVANVKETADANCNNLQNGVQSIGEIKNSVNSVKKKAKRATTNRSQRSIKPKPVNIATSVAKPAKSPVLSDKSDQTAVNVSNSVLPISTAVSTSTTSSSLPTRIAADRVITLSSVGDSYVLLNKENAISENIDASKTSSTHKNVALLSANPSACPPNTMTDILAQATESIFANSMSDISNSPNPTYFVNCSSTENVDFLNTLGESTSKNVTLPSTNFTNVLSTCTKMTSNSEPRQINPRNCSIIIDEIDNHPLNSKQGVRSESNNAADILSDLVGEVYRTANSSSTLISTPFEGESHVQSQCNVTIDNTNVNGRLALTESAKAKRNSTEDENVSSKRNKLSSKVSTDDVTLSSTTVTSSSVSFLSVSQLASSASVTSSNAVTSNSSTVTFSNPITTSVMPFSIDTVNSNDNSPLCSISPLLNSPNKSNDIFALSSAISAEDHAFVNTTIAPSVNNSNISNVISSIAAGTVVTSSAITVSPPTSTLAFPSLTSTFGVNNPLTTSTPVATALTELNFLAPNNGPDLQNNYRALSYHNNQSHRTNFNGMINFQSSDSVGFSLPSSITSSSECFMDKNSKTPNFDYNTHSRLHSSSRTHAIAISSASNCVTGTPSAVQFSTSEGSQTAQFNRIQTYSSIPLSHPVSPRQHHFVPSPVNVDLSHNNEIACNVNKNKSNSPRQSNINASDSIVGQTNLISPTGIHSGCLQRSGSVHHLPGSAGNHLEVISQLGPSGIACNQSQQQRQSHNYSNSNQRLHPINRQSPQMCASSTPSPKATSDHHGHSPVNHRGSSGSSNNAGASSNTNVSPKLSPVGHGLSASHGHNSRSTHPASAGQHPSLSSPAAFIHQRSPNLDSPLITSFATESVTMHNHGNNASISRRDSVFPPGQKQLTHPPLGMSQSSTSGSLPRAAISYSAESLIQSQDNNSNNRPNCARENQSTSSSNSVLRQTAPMHNTGSMAGSHTLPFMHGGHLNRTSDDSQQVGFPYFPFQQTSDQTSHLLQLKSNQVHTNHIANSKNQIQNTQPQPNFSFSLMPTATHQPNSDIQQHLQDPQSQQQHQRHSNYLSVGNYGQVPPPMPGLESMAHKDIQVPRPPMTFPCMPPFPASQPSVDQGVPNIRHRHSASFLTTPANRDHTIGSSTFSEAYPTAPGSLAPLPSNGVGLGNANLVSLPNQGTEKATSYKVRTQNANKQDGSVKLSKSKQSSKKKNQQYQIEEVNLSNSIFETGRSTTPYFPIPNLSPPLRNNDCPTYIPNTNPLFNKSRVGKNNSSLSSSSASSNHSKSGDSYNTLFHARPQTGFNLNFQAPTFTVNHLHGSAVNNEPNNGGGAVNQIGGAHVNAAPPPPPPPPLVSSSSSHVPNFNLSNIFPDINAANESLNISPIKFHSNHILPPPPTPGSSQSVMDGHSLQHSQSGPLYHANRSHHPPPPPPPSVIHNGMTINSILSHSPHSFDGRAQMPVGINNTMTPWAWTSNIQ